MLVVGPIPNSGLVRSKFELVLVCYIGFRVVCTSVGQILIFLNIHQAS
jgi:hypothetical protein